MNSTKSLRPWFVIATYGVTKDTDIISETCRKRHIKCDKNFPRCRKCIDAQRVCIPVSPISFWKGSKSQRNYKVAQSSQPWMRVPQSLMFINGNPQESTEVPDGRIESPKLSPIPDVQIEAVTTARNRDHNHETSTVEADSQAIGVWDSDFDHSSNSPWHRSFRQILELFDTPTSLALNAESASTGPSQSRGLLPLPGADNATAPEQINDSTTGEGGSCAASQLLTATEARLLQHYATKLAPWFDVTDSSRQFQITVPQRALSSAVLLNAVLACSSLHYFRMQNDVPEAQSGLDSPEFYHGRCVALLIPLMGDEFSATNDDVLAAAVILRKYEELSVLVTGRDNGHHLKGVSTLFSLRSSASRGGLGEAAFWQFVRQDVYMSLFTRQAPRVDFFKPMYTFTFESAADDAWANHIVFLTLGILNFSFANQPRTASAWNMLNDYVNTWNSRKPSSFTPFFELLGDEQNGRFWPEIHLPSTWHATGLQYFHISKLLLAMSNPSIPLPQSGIDYLVAQKQMATEILFHSRRICGIAVCSPVATTRFTMCPVMLLCGGWFTNPAEQRAIVDVLSRTETMHGWPSKHITNQLIRDWYEEAHGR